MIDHLVYLRWLKKGGEHISVYVGVRHREAQYFALEMLQKFGPALAGSYSPGPHVSFVGFKLGKLCSWPLPWALYPDEIGIDACVKTIMDGLQDTLRPLVEGITSDSAMYAFLTQTQITAMRPLNGAVHAAEIVFVGKRLGYSQSKIMSDIDPFLPSITNQINRALTVEDYLERVWSSA
jgi:hypothetical protein